MALKKLLGSKWSRRLSALSFVAQAASALKRGKTKLAVLLVTAAAIAYRSSAAGVVLELLLRGYRRKRA
ncbi:hypothetical protein [Halegenticoccus tardaugens]|uniref:hypothetical protein n=1 Tax=Halegenticoccus tardaugens TaxID=2071624 RepID=UPI00100BFD63|nr:hypothetical protein [Halegenticoccus tardaugens]